MTDIVERLRNVAVVEWCEPMCAEAADEIERLRSEVHTLSTSCGHCGDLERAGAEAERLRDTLRRIGMPGREIVYCRDGHEEAVLHARAALKESGHD